MKIIMTIALCISLVQTCYSQTENNELTLSSPFNKEIRSDHFCSYFKPEHSALFVYKESSQRLITEVYPNYTTLIDLDNTYNIPSNDAGSIGKRLVIGAAGGVLIGWVCGMLAMHGGNDGRVEPWVIVGGVVGAVGITLYFSF